ncbi:hypothetical protein S7335_4335 [Synechococcus sp. PCC 7335]|uniref:DUF6940 family protein n=1 Tax=Synechococcus sp. (strain ATCC 29403 / PCC 7335) TaxID=91464 RepID=UPI00017EE43B|nr:hypothetical protein [Synechococcus sp. PCC 7335]EDX86630.1 hypothetical protein S7335_4335 [Synechococcus sp. PCC 7335]
MLQISTQTTDAAETKQTITEIAERRAALITFVDRQGLPFSWVQIAKALIEEAAFRELWNQCWGSLDFDFEWKPVPIHPYTAQSHPFFAIAFPATFRPADPTDFQPYLQALAPNEETALFSNFSGDAQLLTPKPTGDYGHIAAFCRTAEASLQHALWQRVGELCTEAIAEQKSVWCNTHGHGVPWLHVRFDSRLKYASFPPRGSISANSQAIWYQQIYQPVLGIEESDEA